jgi:serine-type D-Ala-D-Ala carboxypeptidase/endopeptidase
LSWQTHPIWLSKRTGPVRQGFARAIARRENATEDQLYSRVITGPLGMRDTAIALSPAQHARLAQGYQPDGQPAPENAPGWPALDGAGALRSTLNDMMRYLDFELGKTNWR